MIVHSFIPQVAKDHGVDKAILIYYLYLWIEKNALDGDCIQEGRVWCRCSRKALIELFPYMGEFGAYRKLDDLSKSGFLLKGNFNDKPTDRTMWYAFSDDAIAYLESILQNCTMHIANPHNANCSSAQSTKRQNPSANKPVSILQNCTMDIAEMHNDIDIDNISSKDINISTTEKEINKEKGRKPKFVADLSFITDPEHLALFKEWMEYRHQLGCPYQTQKGVEGGYKKLLKLSGGVTQKMRDIMDQSISEEWQGLFAIKDHNNGRSNQQNSSAILIPLESKTGGSSTI